MSQEINERPRYTILKQIFQLQVAMVVIGTVLLGVMYQQDFGFFWHCFLLGALGASIALQRELDRKSDEQIGFLAGDRIAIQMAVLYGGLMAAVAYGIFMSKLVSGSDSQAGLLSSNVFPQFILRPVACCEECGNCDVCSSTGQQDEEQKRGVTWNEFFHMRPEGIDDLGKLFVWCFLAGYSKSFVTGLLSRLEQSGGQSKDSSAPSQPTQKAAARRRRSR